MSKPADCPAFGSPDVPLTVTHRVRDACLCLHAQRAARALARHFDKALRPVGVTNGQFSLMMSLNRPVPATIGEVARLLAMDRTSLTAMLKPLARRGWVEISVDEKDRRGRRLALTGAGRAALARAVPIWEREHAAIEAGLADPQSLRDGLNAIAFDHGIGAAAETPRPAPAVSESGASQAS
jgi:DNA-binding MarR family transcriptional regulator